MYSINKFIKDNSDALITVKDLIIILILIWQKFPKGLAQIVITKKFYRRQEAPRVYSVSTICYVANPNYILKTKNIFDGKVTVAKFDKKSSIDIDDN